MDVVTAIDTTIYKRLSQNGDIVALVKTHPTNTPTVYQIYNTQALPRSPYPLIVFYELPSEVQLLNTAYCFYYRICAWAYNKAEANKIMGFVRETLDRKQFVESGWEIYQVLERKPTSTVANVEGNQVYGQISQYEFMVK